MSYSRYKKFARTMDWALAWASVPLAAYLVWRALPGFDVWAAVGIASIPLAFAMAKWDLQKRFDAWLRIFLIRRTLG